MGIVQLGQSRYVRDARWKLPGERLLFDMKEAPYRQIPVAADQSSEETHAARAKLQAVLESLQERPSAPAPVKRKKKSTPATK